MILRPDCVENDTAVTRSRSRMRDIIESGGGEKGIVKKVQWSVARVGEGGGSIRTNDISREKLDV
jgi:hypothetical protein